VANRYPLAGVESGVILVAGRIFGPQNDQDIVLLLDTGASITTLRSALLIEVGIDLSMSKEQRLVSTMSGTVAEGVIKVPRLRIFSEEQSSLEVVFTERPFPYQVDGVLGINFLLPCRLCLDFPAGWIELYKSQHSPHLRYTDH